MKLKSIIVVLLSLGWPLFGHITILVESPRIMDMGFDQDLNKAFRDVWGTDIELSFKVLNPRDTDTPILQELADPACEGMIGLGPEFAHKLRDLATQQKNHGKPLLGLFLSPKDLSMESTPLFRETRIPMLELLGSDLDAFSRLVPIRHLVVFYDEGSQINTAQFPEFRHFDKIDWIAVRSGEGTPLVEKLPKTADGVYLMALMHTTQDALRQDLADLSARKIPTFSMLGDIEVDMGALASMNTRKTFQAISRSAALDLKELMDGIRIERSRMVLPSTQLTINMRVVDQLGLELAWPTLAEARLVHLLPSQKGEILDLKKAIRLTLDHNLSLAVRQREVLAGESDVKTAKANLLPQLQASVTGQTVDSAHAIPALGQYKSFAVGSLQLTQLIYSEDARAGVEAQRQAQRARMADRDTLRQDIARASVEAFFNLLKIETLVEIRRDDVHLNRTNLHLASIRQNLGAARPSEVERWKAQLANAQAALLEAYAQKRQAEREMSRLFNRPLDTKWNLKDESFEELLAVIGGTSHVEVLGQRQGYSKLLSELVRPAKEQSTELLALDALIAAQMRELRAAKRAFSRPSVGLQAQLNNTLLKDENGGVQLGEIAEDFGSFPDTSWNVALQVSMPVFTGGTRKARSTKALLELEKLQTERAHVVTRISQRLLSALDMAAASYPQMALKNKAAQAAQRTLEMVQDAYAHGADSILVLLDAQNTALATKLDAQQAEYTFLEDWADVQRALNQMAP